MSHRKALSRGPKNLSPQVTHVGRVTLARLLPVSIGNNNGGSDVLQVRLAAPLTAAQPRHTITGAQRGAIDRLSERSIGVRNADRMSGNAKR